MSAYVYIAHEGLRKTPISREAWLSAVSQCKELAVDESRSYSAHREHVVRLKRDRRVTLRLDHHGIAGARDPSRELVGVMFKVASYLGANIYSERFNQYTSTDDWTRRRRKHRRAVDKQRAYKGSNRLIQVGLCCTVLAASTIFGFVAAYAFLALKT